jgi:hypothetical protein
MPKKNKKPRNVDNQNNNNKVNQKRSKFYDISSKIVLFLTGVSALLTIYDLCFKYFDNTKALIHSSNSFNLTDDLFSNNLSLNNRTISNSTVNIFKFDLNETLNKINLICAGISLLPQIAFISYKNLQLNLKFLKNEIVKKYLKDNHNSSYIISVLPKLITLKKPKNSEKFIEENYGRYIFYQLLRGIDDIESQKKILFDIIENLHSEKKFLLEKKVRFVPEINLFFLRFFESSLYNLKKRKLKIINESLNILENFLEDYHYIPQENIEKFIQKYSHHLNEMSKYSREKSLFYSFLTQNFVSIGQLFDAIVTTYSVIGLSIHNPRTFFTTYTILSLGNGTSWMGYNSFMNLQKNHEIILKNTLKLLRLKNRQSLDFILSEIINPGYSVEKLRKEQSYFSSINLHLLPIMTYFLSLGYSHFFDNLRYEKTTMIRSLSIVSIITLMKRPEICLKLFENEINKTFKEEKNKDQIEDGNICVVDDDENHSQLEKLSCIFILNILMPQGVILSFVKLMKDNNFPRYVTFGGDIVGNALCGFLNVFLNLKSQGSTYEESRNNLNNIIQYLKSEPLNNTKDQKIV